MKRAVITGATGMIGKALIKLLIQESFEVTLIIRPNSKRMNGIPVDENTKVIECPLDELRSLENRLIGRYDTFFHLGWDGTYGNARNNMNLQINNIQYCLDAVELARKIGCTTFLGAGSQAEYGRMGEIKLSSELKTNPETGYGIGKLCAGQMSRIKCKEYGIKHVWTRILSVYGPHDGIQTMVMSAIKSMLNGDKLSCTKGEQLWDYLYCKDAANALYLAAKNGRDGAIYCIGSGQVKPLKEYVKCIRDAINPNLEIGFGDIPYFDNQVMYLCADINELIADTAFVPLYTFKEGIIETIAWYKEEEML